MGFLLDEPFRLDALALGLLACLLFCWLLRLLWPRRSVVDEYPYQTVPLFTACEERFLDALEDAIEGRLAIFGKVRLADLIEVIPGQDRASWGRAFNRIDPPHRRRWRGECGGCLGWKTAVECRSRRNSLRLGGGGRTIVCEH